MRDTIAAGRPPSEVADLVFAAVAAQQFLVLTTEHHAKDLAVRGEQLAHLELPAMVDFT